MKFIERRDFIKKVGLSVGAASLIPSVYGAVSRKTQNSLPKWKGFNLLDFFSPDPEKGRKNPKEYLQWIADWGFDFVRIPVSYPAYINFDRSRPIRKDEVLNFDEKWIEEIEQLLYNAHQVGLHTSLNLHRVPGFCINAGFEEPFNLWKDQDALDAFVAHWEMWSTRMKGINSQKLSFDLVNEPFMRQDPNDQHSPGGPVPVEDYRRVAKAAVDAIHAISPDRLVIANGNGGGGIAVPELADLELSQSCRGYNPMIISHFEAPWVYKDAETLTPPTWPGEYNGQQLNREMIERYYQPWFDLMESGVGVHCGECGSYNKTPHNLFLNWFGDVLDVLDERDIGFGIWEFSGSFGVLNSGRSDVDYADWYGEKLDKKMLTMLTKNM